MERPRSLPLFYCEPAENLYLLVCPQMDKESEERLRSATISYLESLPEADRGERSYVAFVSTFVRNWSNAEQYTIVNRLESLEDLNQVRYF